MWIRDCLMTVWFDYWNARLDIQWQWGRLQSLFFHMFCYIRQEITYLLTKDKVPLSKTHCNLDRHSHKRWDNRHNATNIFVEQKRLCSAGLMVSDRMNFSAKQRFVWWVIMLYSLGNTYLNGCVYSQAQCKNSGNTAIIHINDNIFCNCNKSW